MEETGAVETKETTENLTGRRIGPGFWLIACILFFLAILIWPLKLLGHTVYTSASLEQSLLNHISLSEGYYLRGRFVPTHSRLESLSFKFGTGGQSENGLLFLEIFDAEQNSIACAALPAAEIYNNRWYSFPLDIRLQPGAVYDFQLNAQNCETMSLSLYAGNTNAGPAEAGECYYNGTQLDSITPAVIYQYRDRVDKAHVLPYYFCLLVLGLFVLTVFQKFGKPHGENAHEN